MNQTIKTILTVVITALVVSIGFYIWYETTNNYSLREDLKSGQVNGKKLAVNKKVNKSKDNTEALLNDIGLKIIYPKKWGELKTTDGALQYVTFSKLLVVRPSDNYIFDNMILFDGQRFLLGVTNDNKIIKAVDTFVGGGEGVTFNVKFFDYMKNKIASSGTLDGACSESIFGIEKCFDLKKVSNKKHTYLTYFTFRDYDGSLQKNWLTFVGDKVILVHADVDDMVTYNADNAQKPKTLTNADFNFDKKKLRKLDNAVMEFLANVEFINTLDDNDVDKNRDQFSHYVRDVDLAKTTTDQNILNKLSKSNFVKVRANVARNVNTPVDTLIVLANDSSDLVKVGVKYNKKLPKDIADKIENPF